jgi:rhodanese-related sulfurtransferase
MSSNPVFEVIRDLDKNVPTVNPDQVNEKLSELKIVDVRMPDEFTGELGHIKGASLSTLQTDLDPYLDSLDKDQNYVFICRSGNRSGIATQMAESKGFKHSYNMKGGMIAWKALGFEVQR